MDKKIMQVFKNGKYYNPAKNHYNKDVCVSCDRCMSTRLLTCIGYEDLDLCLQCVDTISKIIEKNQIQETQIKTDYLTYMENINRQSRPTQVTRMSQGMYSPIMNDMSESTRISKNNNENILTKMSQGMYRQKNDVNEYTKTSQINDNTVPKINKSDFSDITFMAQSMYDRY